MKTNTTTPHTAKEHVIYIKEPGHDWFDFLSLLIPILTFALAYLLTGLINRSRKKREAERTLDFFITFLKEADDSAKMQLKVIDFQIKSISEIKHLPTRETILHPFFLYNSVDYVLLMESYRFLKEDVTDMLDKISKVEKLRGIVDGFDAIVEEQQKMYNDCRNEWSNLVKEVDQRVNVLEPILQKVEDMSVFDEFLDLIKVCTKLNEEDENDLSVFLNKYYLPLKKVFFKVFEETKDSQIATIIHYINQLNFVDQKMIRNREHFITASNNLKQQLEKITPISK